MNSGQRDKKARNYLESLVVLSDLIDKIVMWLGAVLLALMAIDILVAVFFRYVLESTLVWSEEMARYMMIWMACIAMSHGIKKGEHLTIRFLTDALPSRIAFWLDMFIRCFLFIFLIVLTLYGVGFVNANTVFTSQATEVNMAIPTSAVPVAGALMILQLIVNTLLEFRKSGEVESR